MRIALAILSTAVLSSLIAYIYLAYSGKSETLYSTVDRRLVSPRRRIFLVLCAIGGITCLYKGAEVLLFWVPHSVGPFGNDEVGIRDYLAGGFAFYSGIFFLLFVDGATHNGFFLRQANAERRELKRILAASESLERLQELQNEFEAEINRLNQRLYGQEVSAAHAHPDGQMLMVYRELLAIVGSRIQRLPSEA